MSASSVVTSEVVMSSCWMRSLSCFSRELRWSRISCTFPKILFIVWRPAISSENVKNFNSHEHTYCKMTFYVNYVIKHPPSLSWGLGNASLRVSSGPPRSLRLLMCRFMARWSSVLVKLAFSCASKYFSRSLRSSARAEGCSGTACFPAASSKLRSSASSSSNTSRISRKEASTSVNTPERTEDEESGGREIGYKNLNFSYV